MNWSGGCVFILCTLGWAERRRAPHPRPPPGSAGASGFVLEPSVAESLGLEAFGELHITGVSGKVKSQFR